MIKSIILKTDKKMCLIDIHENKHVIDRGVDLKNKKFSLQESFDIE